MTSRFRALTALAAGALVVASGLAVAPSASATNIDAGTVTVSESSSVWSATPSTLTFATSGDQFTVTNNASDTVFLYNADGLVAGNSSTCDTTNFYSLPNTCKVIHGNSTIFEIAGTGSISAEIWYIPSSGNTSTTGISITLSSGSSTAASVPVPASMSLQLGEGAGAAVCMGGSPSGFVGSWMTLPGQGDCRKADAPSAKLLGWSTSSAFPVAVAQNQADKGWGAYEQTDADGNVTAIFIPAGWATFVSGSNNLYPVWAQ